METNTLRQELDAYADQHNRVYYSLINLLQVLFEQGLQALHVTLDNEYDDESYYDEFTVRPVTVAGTAYEYEQAMEPSLFYTDTDGEAVPMPKSVLQQKLEDVLAFFYEVPTDLWQIILETANSNVITAKNLIKV